MLVLGLGFSTQHKPILPLIDLTDPSPQQYVPDWDSLDEFTAHIRISDDGAPGATQNLWAVLVDSNNYIQGQLFSNGRLHIEVRSGGTTVSKQIVDLHTSYALGQGDISITVAYKANDLVIAVNGIICLESIDTIPAPIGTPIDMGIGENTNGVADLSASIREFKYYNKRLSNSRIRSIGQHTVFGVTANYDVDRRIVYSTGQSNSVGETSSTPSLTYTNIANMGLVSKDGVLDTSYQDPSADNGTGALFSNFSDAGVFSGVGTFMDDMITELGGKAAVAHVDRGATGLVDTNGNFTWKAYTTSGSETTIGIPAYQATLMQMVAAIHGTRYIRVWYQGEQDAKNATITQQDYTDALVELLTLFDNHAPVSITVVIGLSELPAETYPNRSTIVSAQADMPNQYSNTHYVSASGYEREADNIHLSEQGQQDLWSGVSVELGFSQPPVGGGGDFDPDDFDSGDFDTGD